MPLGNFPPLLGERRCCQGGWCSCCQCSTALEPHSPMLEPPCRPIPSPYNPILICSIGPPPPSQLLARRFCCQKCCKQCETENQPIVPKSKYCKPKDPSSGPEIKRKLQEEEERKRGEAAKLFEIKIRETLSTATRELGQALKNLKKAEKDGRNKGIFEAESEFAIKDITDNEEEEKILENVSTSLKNTRNNVVSIEKVLKEIEFEAGKGDISKAKAALTKFELTLSAVKNDVRELNLAIKKIGAIFVISRTELLSF